ncbi:MAG: hypothetical protein HKM04_06270, partial [Legionellales bacterium]|nr:hypothetical protein [Legionellales bacterium]
NDIQLKKTKNEEERANLLNLISNEVEKLNDSDLMQSQEKKFIEKKRWNEKIGHIFEKKRQGNKKNKIIKRINERYILLNEWYKYEKMLISLEEKESTLNLNEIGKTSKNRDELSSLTENVYAIQEKNEEKLKKLTDKIKKAMRKKEPTSSANAIEFSDVENTISVISENTIISENLALPEAEPRHVTAPDSFSQFISSVENEEFMLLSLPKKHQVNEENNPVDFEWKSAVIAERDNHNKKRDFLTQPFKENAGFNSKNEDIFDFPLSLDNLQSQSDQNSLSHTNYFDYLDNENISLIQDEKLIIEKAATFLKDIKRIGNLYQVDFLFPRSQDVFRDQQIDVMEKEFNAKFQSILLSFRRHWFLDETHYLYAILLFFLKSYYIVKQGELVLISDFTKRLGQWSDDIFDDKQQITHFIRELEGWTLPDAPQTLFDFEKNCQNEPLYSVFFREYIGQWAAVPVQIGLRSAIKIINNDLDVALSTENTGENSNTSSLSFKLTFDLAQEKKNKPIIFDYTQQNIRLINQLNPELNAALPKDVKASIRHVYSEQEKTFVQEGEVSATGALRPFLDYYKKRKLAYQSTLSREEIELVPEGQRYKGVQMFPLTEGEKNTQKTLKNVLEAFFLQPQHIEIIEVDKPDVKKSKPRFGSSMAKIKNALSFAAKKINFQKETEKPPIILSAEEDQIEEKAKKGFFANSIFNRKKSRRRIQNQCIKQELLQPNADNISFIESSESALNNEAQHIIKKGNMADSLLENLTSWSTLKTTKTHRSFTQALDADDTICQAKLEVEGKLMGEFFVFPEQHLVQARGQNCCQLIYEEMLTVLTGHQTDAEDTLALSSSLIIVNASPKMRVEKIAEVFKTLIKQNCVPCLKGETSNNLEIILSHLDEEDCQKMHNLIDSLKSDERVEYERGLQELTALAMSESVSNRPLRKLYC